MDVTVDPNQLINGIPKNDYIGTNNNDYTISQLSYPADLDSMPEYGGNKVVFYINIANASKFQADPAGGSINMLDLDIPRVRGEVVATDLSLNGIQSAASAVGLGIGASMLSGISSGSGGFGSFAKGIIGTAAKLGVGAVAGGAVLVGMTESISGTTTREQRRLKSAIALHVPNNLIIRYNADWQSDEMLGGAIAEAGLDALGLIKSVNENNDSNLTDSGTKSIATSLGLSKLPGGNYASAKSGLASNPRKELIFKGVDFRTFTFDYSFFPRSEHEAKNVENIINTFKFHMHPEFKDAGKFLYLYPSEFDISYYTNDGENTHIHRHTSCVLTEMSITYTPNGNYTTFRNGMSTQVNISLSFKELALMSKELIKQGY